MIGPGRTAVLVAGLLTVVAGCAIRADSTPRDIAADNPARDILAPVGAGGGEASGGERIYLARAGDGAQLRTVARDARGSDTELLTALLEGPFTAEAEEGYGSALPPGLELRSPVRVTDGVVNIDVSDEILDLPGNDQQLAVAQLVLTANEIEGAESVVIRVDGTARDWPDGRGTQQSRPLTVYDFAGFAESSQPAFPATPSQTTVVTTTTTTTTPPPPPATPA